LTSQFVGSIYFFEMPVHKKESLLAALFATLVLFSAAVLPALPQAMEITVNSVSHKDKSPNLHLKLYKQMGVTSIQTYIYWNAIEKEPGVIDWAKYDADVALLKKQGLKWVPFLIVGPWYVTPEFVREDKDIVMFRCLEHHRDSSIPSIWCPRLREYVQAFLQKFLEHYSPQGIFESINLGISGDYGEAIYPAIGNWPTKYHSHPGFWCGDALAAADFRRAMSELYQGDIAAEVRRLVDYDFCDERMVQEGALKGKLILIVIGADILESQTLAKIQTWVSDGGLLFVLDCRPADWDGNTTITDGLEGFTSGSEEVHGISELAVREPKRLPLIAALQAIFVNRAFTGLAPDIEPLLAMQFAPEGSVAWSRVQGGGKIYAYFGPMDLKKKEDSWMESYQLPSLFLKDSLQDSFNEGRLKKMPLSLISNLQEVYLVETMDGLFALNMSPVTQKVRYPGGSFEIGAESIKVIENKQQRFP